MKTRDIILERKMETRMWQKCHAARDNTTPLMRKVPESEGDGMRSALQEVLVSGVGWEARELCNLQSFFTHESSNSCQMASYEAFRDSCRAPFSSLHRLELQQLKRASYWRQMVRQINEAEWNIWKETQTFIFIYKFNILSWWNFKFVKRMI